MVVSVDAAFAMVYVAGVTIKELLGYRSALRPATLLGGPTAAGAFLRHLHALEVLPPIDVDLREEAKRVLAVAEEKLHPLRLSLPDRVRRTMVESRALTVTSPQVRLHGDFGPANILLARDCSTVGLDAALSAVGDSEDDLVRFVALVSGRSASRRGSSPSQSWRSTNPRAVSTSRATVICCQVRF